MIRTEGTKKKKKNGKEAQDEPENISGDITIGVEAAKKRHILKLSHPIKNGIVFDWPDMEKVWRHGFENLGLYEREDFADKKILVTVAPKNPMKNIKQMAKCLLMDIGFGGFQLALQGMCTLFSEVFPLPHNPAGRPNWAAGRHR